MRVLVLIDGLHGRELLESVTRLVAMDGAEVLLAYVRGPHPHSGLDLLGRRAGGRHVPPHREREVRKAEDDAMRDAIAEAERSVQTVATSVEAIELSGEPGPSVCELAARRDVDVIAIRSGGRDAPRIGRESIGPTARFVAEHSRVPVLLVRGI